MHISIHNRRWCSTRSLAAPFKGDDHAPHDEGDEDKKLAASAPAAVAATNSQTTIPEASAGSTPAQAGGQALKRWSQQGILANLASFPGHNLVLPQRNFFLSVREHDHG